MLGYFFQWAQQFIASFRLWYRKPSDFFPQSCILRIPVALVVYFLVQYTPLNLKDIIYFQRRIRNKLVTHIDNYFGKKLTQQALCSRSDSSGRNCESFFRGVGMMKTEFEWDGVCHLICPLCVKSLTGSFQEANKYDLSVIEKCSWCVHCEKADMGIGEIFNPEMSEVDYMCLKCGTCSHF